VKRVVTLPADAEANAFAERAKRSGADLLELRDDLTPGADVAALAARLPVLLALRGGPGFPPAARKLAVVDGPDGALVSWHAPQPLTPDAAEREWAQRPVPTGALVKHVEPIGEVHDASRLFETQRRLIARFGADRVTVLATGACALPFRAVLAQHNALDFCALDGASASAPGQRLLRDAVRADAASGPRFALIGHRIEKARSPWAHPPPFDRWDLPPGAPVRALIDALAPHYRGFAITSPFKRAFGPDAINTLARHGSGWRSTNTDIDGARVVLAHHGVRQFTVLGNGGAAWAMRAASLCAEALHSPTVVTAHEAAGQRLRGDVVWTWPEHLPTPRGLSLSGARVLVITYGATAQRLARRIRALGGEPILTGARWFAAQARAQRRFWQEAS
jgi:shikimate 5-dehydrogenase